jgi:hypothetical protein
MSDTPPPRRRLWQIHLSTAVVMMLIGSAAIYLSTKQRCTFGVLEGNVVRVETYGFPFPAFARVGWTGEQGIATRPDNDGLRASEVLLLDGTAPDPNKKFLDGVHGYEVTEAWDWKNICYDIATMALIAFSLSYCLEYLIRRRSKP